MNFEKKSLKLKSVLYLLFKTVLDNYAFKIETSWAERVVKLLPETGNNNDLSLAYLFSDEKLKKDTKVWF